MNTNQTNGVPVAVEYRNGTEWVDGRSLHTALDIGRDFTTWVKSRIEQYQFIEGEDYETCSPDLGSEKHGGQNKVEYSLTIDMAKELAMLENNEQGRAIRKYFIGVERASRELAAKFQALGGTHQVMTFALMGRVYQLFANYREVDIKSIFHIMELSLAKSALTGQYVMAKDVARAVRGEADGKTMSEGYIEAKVTEIRQLIEDFGFVPNMVRLPNGNYKALPLGKEAADE